MIKQIFNKLLDTLKNLDKKIVKILKLFSVKKLTAYTEILKIMSMWVKLTMTCTL